MNNNQNNKNGQWQLLVLLLKEIADQKNLTQNENGLGLDLNEINLETTDLEEKYDEILQFLYDCLEPESFDISSLDQMKNDLQFTMPSGNYYHASGEFFYNKNTDKYEEKVQDVDGKVYKVEW